ncbi:MAG TPA: hypothetical protein PK281_00825, partial [Flavobacteriales bacterium]|nr:hypothetical protein [Flavobacteriales bacterium]
DTHTNCANVDCNLLFIQCENCQKEFNGCCSAECMEIIALPEETQKELRKNKNYQYSNMLYRKGRLRPSGPQLQQYTLKSKS